MRLAEKIALVTGGGAGIGRAICLALGREGADVIVADIRSEPAGAVAAEVRALGRRSEGVALDVTLEVQVRRVIADAIRGFGRLDILVNNAGVIPKLGLPFTRQDEGDWDRVFAVNLKAVFFTCKAIAPHFMERRAGKIVNIASIAGPMSSTTMPSYSVSKQGVVTFTKIVAKELAPYGVNVNAVCPGLLWTDMWKEIAEHIRPTNPAYASLTPREMFERRVQEWIPLRREQTPEDIGDAVAFLASDAARNITGQALMVDGGACM
ncbi:MAG: SDR family oxidoreductase [candidate division NC10 bacterium]|nr:SDR family oxidoreductase [candidate division NC10 bacterium]